MKTQHAGDCTIYSSLSNKAPWDGICTCGYGWEQYSKGNHTEMLSEEKLAIVEPPLHQRERA